MRLRGLPRELNCGNVELAPVKNCQYARIFPSCISCEFTSVEYFELECGHVHCESCLVFETLSRNEPRVLCTVCNQVCLATVKEISLTALFTAKFECPCGEEGSLHQLRGHRSSCRQSQRRKPCDLNESHASCSSSTSSSASTSSISVLLPPVASPKSTEVTSRLSALQQMIQRADEKSDSLRNLEFVVKGYIAEELNRLKEDLSNTSRAERLTCEAALARIGDRIDYLNSRIDHTNTLENRIMYLERAAPRTEATQQIMARIENLTLQVEELQNEEDSEISDSSMQQFIRLQSKSAFLWFDVKTLLRDFNRSRESSSTESQSILVAGYPCEVHLQIEYESNMKTLFAYIRNCEDIDFSASWPMRRNMIFRIHDCHGEYLFENKFSTTEPVCREYFKGPGTHFFGTYYGFELCSVEELTSENSYQRNNGMVCLVITANPCGGGSFDD